MQHKGLMVEGRVPFRKLKPGGRLPRLNLHLRRRTRGSAWWARPTAGVICRNCLAYGPLHLKLDQPVELNRVLKWQFLGDRLDKASDDEAHGLGFVDAAAL